MEKKTMFLGWKTLYYKDIISPQLAYRPMKLKSQ